MRRAALAAALLALVAVVWYGLVLAPDWEPRLNDQVQYLALARGFVERGEFTRAGAGEAFFPESNRLPGYPLLLATLCVAGCSHWTIAFAQAVLLALVVLLAHRFALRVLPGARRALAATWLVALYLPFAYFAALALSDAAATFLVAAALAAWLRARDRSSPVWAAAAGSLLGWAALMRAALAPLPLVIAALALARGRREAVPAAAALVAAFALVVAPYVAYAEVNLGRPVAANGGTVLWLGYLQGKDAAALDDVERAQVESARVDIARFDAIADRRTRAFAWVDLDASLADRARSLIARDPVGYVARAVQRSAELWAGDRPVPGGDAGPVGDALLAAGQLALLLFGLVGAARLARHGGEAGIVAVSLIATIWLVSVPFQTEGRYALPAKPFLIIAAVAGFDALRRRQAASASARLQRSSH